MDTDDFIVTFSHGMPRWHREEIRSLLEECDGDFVPPLSKRSLPWQTHLLGDGSSFPNDGIDACIQSMEEESFFVTLGADGRAVAFLSYIPRHVHPEETDGEETNYVTTICVRPDYRKRGLARRMYGMLAELVKDGSITVRTWSTNHRHIRLLESLGYEERRRVPDDRGHGIDTVYYVWRHK